MGWYSVDNLLKLAIYLSSVNYYLGVLLLSAPLPVQAKRLGLRMAYQGAVSALLASLYTTIIYSVEYILSVLGLSWDSLAGFYAQATGFSASLYAFAAGVTVGSQYLLREMPRYAKVLGSFLASSVVKNVVRASTVIAVSEAAVKVIATFTLLYWPLLLLIGIVLYSIPGGIGRRVGASLIASAIVLYIGLPFLPYWVDMWLYAAKNANPVAGLILGGSEIPVYMLWGYVKGVIFEGSDSSVSVVLWKGGVANGFPTIGEYHFFYPLVPGAYRLSVYVGKIRVWDGIVKIPDDCRGSGFEAPNIYTALQAMLESIIKGGLRACRYDIDFKGRLAILADHLVFISRGELKPIILEYNVSSSEIDALVWFGGSGYAEICYGCSCNGIDINATVEAKWSRGCVECIRIRVSKEDAISVRLYGCRGGLSEVAPKGGFQTSLLTLLLHDLPLAFYTIALAYGIAVWSFLAVLSLAIYGFGRVLGESSVLVIKLRY